MTKIELYQKLSMLSEDALKVFWTLHSINDLESLDDMNTNIPTVQYLGERMYDARMTLSEEVPTWDRIKGAISNLHSKGLILNDIEYALRSAPEKFIRNLTWKEIKSKNKGYVTIAIVLKIEIHPNEYKDMMKVHA